MVQTFSDFEVRGSRFEKIAKVVQAHVADAEKYLYLPGESAPECEHEGSMGWKDCRIGKDGSALTYNLLT